METIDSDKSQHRVFVSVKSTINPRPSDKEFVDVISKGWQDWQAGATFDREKDFFLLAAADRLDFERRLSLEGYHNSSVREVHQEVNGIIKRETQTTPHVEALRQFLGRLFASTFDFDHDASQDKSRVIGVLRLASESRDGEAANSCWNAVFENLSLETAKAKVLDTAELESISRQHGLRVDTSVRTRTWLTNLREHCRMTRDGIATTLFTNRRHIIRQQPLRELGEGLSTSQFILVTGSPGSGKSALAVEAAETFAKPESVFCFLSEELAHPHLDAALQAGGLRDLNPQEWADALPFEPRVLVIDALERLLQSSGSRHALDQLLRIAATDRRWRVVVTCRDYLADHVLDTWSVPGDWNLVSVPVLELGELQEAVSNSGIPVMWLEQPAVREAIRNLKWLDLTMRAAQRIKAPIQTSAWATLADWRDFVWHQLLNPEMDPRGQELLVSIGLQRTKSGSPWVALDSASLITANQLRTQGILRKHNLFSDRYRPEHDLLEDWALLFYVRRAFTDHGRQPTELFDYLGNSLMLRRAFRQFLGELLEGDTRNAGVTFIRQAFAEASCGKEWREEVVNALLGSSCAKDTLYQTQDIWTEASGEGLRVLRHMLRLAYLAKPRNDVEPERPFGPGWNAVMSLVHSQGDHYLREHTRIVGQGSGEAVRVWRCKPKLGSGR